MAKFSLIRHDIGMTVQRDQTMARYKNFTAGLRIGPVQQSWSFVVTRVLVAAMALAMVGFWAVVVLIYSLLAS